MALKMVLASMDDVPDALHEFYVEKDGKFILDAEGVDDHPAVANLKNAYRAEQDKRRKLADDLKAASEKISALPEDFSVDEWSRLRMEEEARAADPDNKDRRKEIETAVSSTRKQYEDRMAKEKAKWEAQLAAEREERNRIDGQLRTTRKSDELTKALKGAKVRDEFFEAAIALHERNVEVVDEDGNYVVKVKADLGGDDVSTYVRNWAQSDQGKAFIEPVRGPDVPGNSGNRRPGRSAGDFGGDRKARQEAIAARFPEIAKAGR